MEDVDFLSPEKGRETARKVADYRRRQRDAVLWRLDWAEAKTGPLPMAHFLVRSWRRVTHKWHPSYLLLSALTAANEALVQRLPDPDDCPSLSTVQRLELRLLRWLTGDRDTECEASARDAALWALLSISSQSAREEGPANRLHHPIVQSMRRPKRHLPEERQSPALPEGSAPLPAASQSPAISTDSRSTASQPPVVADDAEPATPVDPAHRLSENRK